MSTFSRVQRVSVPKPRRKVREWVITGLKESSEVQGSYSKDGVAGGEVLNKQELRLLKKLRFQ
eukprot:symbB.v1.2.002570.t1/scaffold137.1/size303853/1